MMDKCTFMMDRCTFMMDRCTFMMDFRTETAIHSHYKAGKSQDIFVNVNSDCVRLKEESRKHLG